MRGDHDAFAVLAGRSVARLDAAARLILRDPELARDAVQEGFLAAWRNLPTLRDPDRFEAWLRRLVVRSCINTVRHRGRRPMEVELTPLHEPAISDIASIVADRELLDVALRRLRPEARAIVVLHFYLGLPLTDVAESLAIPVGTAKSRLHRATRGDALDDRCGSHASARARGRRTARMTAFDRVEPRIPELMDDLAPARVPDYFDDLLRQTARTRQRPAWISLGRWLPMGVIARGDTLGQVPWRPIAIAAMLIAAAATTLVLIAGSQRRLPPAPFGPTSRIQVGDPIETRWFAADDTSLWVHQLTSMVRVDLATGAVTGTFPLSWMDYGYNATGAGSVWQTDYETGFLVRIDPHHEYRRQADRGRIGTRRRRGDRRLGVGRRGARRSGHARRSGDEPCHRADPGWSDRVRRAADHDGWSPWRLGGHPEHPVRGTGRCRDEHGRAARAP